MVDRVMPVSAACFGGIRVRAYPISECIFKIHIPKAYSEMSPTFMNGETNPLQQ